MNNGNGWAYRVSWVTPPGKRVVDSLYLLDDPGCLAMYSSRIVAMNPPSGLLLNNLAYLAGYVQPGGSRK
jgi:hypothetical protein